jgi:uroporphyrinogen III methyltransferase/synthase
VVGGVASLADSLNWYERLPLFGLRIGITRASKRVSALSAALADLGAEVVEIAVVSPQEEDAAALVREILADGLDLICCTSPSAVHYLARMLGPAHATPVAVSGPTTAHAAREARLEIVPELSANSSPGLARAIVQWSAARR